MSVIAIAGLSSCKTQKEVVKPTKIEKTAVVNTISVPYFKAVGTEPFWGIEISEKGVKFTELGNEEGIFFPNEKLEIFEEDRKTTYSTKTHMLILEAKTGECSDGMSDLTYSHKVVATLIDEETGGATENYGCGQFFADSELNSTWVLESLRGQEVSPKDFGNELPYIDFIVAKNIFIGFAGCNRINGQMKPKSQNRLQLTNIASTKMMCTEENKEQQFMKVLPDVASYKFAGNTLILMNSSFVPVATFTKK